MIKLLTSIFMILFTPLLANEDPTMLIEKRLTEVMRTYDERAYVLVSSEVRENAVELPSVPFIINTKVNLSDQRLQLSRLEVTIFSRLEKIPPNISTVINNFGKKFQVKPVVKMNTVNSYQKKEENPYAIYTQYIPHAAGALLFIALSFFFIQLRNGSQVKNVLETQLTSLGQTFSEGSKSSAPAVASGAAGGGESGKSGKTSVEINTSGSSNWEQYSNETIAAMMADCYWCHEDEYASFVWKRLSISLRSELLDNNSVRADYISYISNLDEVDKSYIDEPYYIKPLAINHISNDELLKIIEESPSLMQMLPKLRSNSLPIKAIDRLNIMKTSSGEEFDKNILEKTETSELRALSSTETFSFTSLEEEEEVISMPEISVENMEQFPSLAWLTKINEESAKDILNSYTAKQLAAIWIAPESILSTLEGYLPKKKKDLLISYSSNLLPSRENSLYNEIVSMAIEEYRKENDDSNESDLKQAA